MKWYNEPSSWHQDGEKLLVKSNPKTDFRRKTHDGGIRDSGHFYHHEIGGNFTAEVKLSGRYTSLYDQAGLMVRLDELNWMKCGIEYVDGIQNASVVCTRDWSDWSVIPLPNPPSVWFRACYQAPTCEVYYSLDGEKYTMIRQAFLPEARNHKIGLMIASPTGDGFEVEFEGFQVR